MRKGHCWSCLRLTQDVLRPEADGAVRLFRFLPAAGRSASSFHCIGTVRALALFINSPWNAPAASFGLPMTERGPARLRPRSCNVVERIGLAQAGIGRAAPPLALAESNRANKRWCFLMALSRACRRL